MLEIRVIAATLLEFPGPVFFFFTRGVWQIDPWGRNYIRSQLVAFSLRERQVGEEEENEESERSVPRVGTTQQEQTSVDEEVGRRHK